MSGGVCLLSVGRGASSRQACRSHEQSVSKRENNLAHARARDSLTRKIRTTWYKTRRRTGGRDTFVSEILRRHSSRQAHNGQAGFTNSA